MSEQSPLGRATPRPEQEPEAQPGGEAPLRPRLWHRLLQVGAVSVVVALVALLAWRVISAERGPNLVAEIGRGKQPPAPNFTLPVLTPDTSTWPRRLRAALADGKISLHELRGTPVVLNFWASWCVPCKKEAPLLATTAKANAGRVAFLGVDVQDFRSDARSFIERYGVSYVSVRDGGDSTYNRYGLTGIPETFYLDLKGRIVAHTIGQVAQSELAAGIRKALHGGGR